MTADLLALADRFGTPFYLHEQESLERAHRDLRDALPTGASIFFSLKSNPNPAVGAVLRAAGCRAEVSSPGELASALEAGFEAREALYTGPGKTDAEVDDAIRFGVRLFSVESIADLHRVNRLAAANTAEVKCVLRINAPAGQGSTGMRMTGTASQFGIDLGSARPTADQIAAAGGNVVGFHFFPVSNTADEAVLIAEIGASIRHARELAADLGITVRLLDLGGGFAAPYARPGTRPTYPGLRAAVEAALDNDFPAWRSGRTEVAFESGRYLTCDSGSLVARVIDVKTSAGTRYAVTDTGINHVGGLSGTGRTPPLSIGLVDHDACPEPSGHPVTVVGALCTPADVLNYRLTGTPELLPGDLIQIPNVGAYGVTASLLGFLSRPTPAEILTHRGAVITATKLTLHRKDLTVTESNLSPWSPEFEAIVRGYLPPRSRDAELGPDTDFADLGVDSLALVQLLGAVEAQCDTVIPDQALADRTVSTPQGLWLAATQGNR